MKLWALVGQQEGAFKVVARHLDGADSTHDDGNSIHSAIAPNVCALETVALKATTTTARANRIAIPPTDMAAKMMEDSPGIEPG